MKYRVWIRYYVFVYLSVIVDLQLHAALRHLHRRHQIVMHKSTAQKSKYFLSNIIFLCDANIDLQKWLLHILHYIVLYVDVEATFGSHQVPWSWQILLKTFMGASLEELLVLKNLLKVEQSTRTDGPTDQQNNMEQHIHIHKGYSMEHYLPLFIVMELCILKIILMHGKN